MIIGLTGGIGSGKSAAADVFSSLGVPIVDADVIARDLANNDPCVLAKIVERFGPSVVQSDKAGVDILDRAALRTIIFNDSEAKTWLEKLLHPLVRNTIVESIDQFKQTGSGYMLLCSPLLFETQQDALTDQVIVVDVSEQTQIERTLARDGSDIETINSILASQCSRQVRLEKADFVLDNEGSLENLVTQVKALHQTLVDREV